MTGPRPEEPQHPARSRNGSWWIWIVIAILLMGLIIWWIWPKPEAVDDDLAITEGEISSTLRHSPAHQLEGVARKTIPSTIRQEPPFPIIDAT